MNFNSVGSLLAVSSAHDTVHIFKLGGQHKVSSASSVSSSDGDSSYATHDSEEASLQGSDGGYEFVGKEKNQSVSYVFSFSFLLNYIY